MITEIYSIRDVRTEAYIRPFFVQNRKVMERALADALSDTSTDFSVHPEDYQVFYLGTFDDATGTIAAVPAEHVCNVIDFKGE